MPILANTRIRLGASNPKKSAVVDQPGTPPPDNSAQIAIWAGASVSPTKTQSIIGDFESLFAYAKSNMPAIAAAGLLGAPVMLHMPTGAGDRDITIVGEVEALPTADEVRLSIGSVIYLGQKSHQLNRTFTRLCEVWLEESK
jgi:hypothetical protein